MKDEAVDLTRRKLTLASALALLSGVTITLSACGGGGGGDSNPAGSSGNGGDGNVSGSISGNHGHSAVITSAQLSGAALSLDIMGAATHPHTVQLSSSELASIGAGQTVSVVSSQGDSDRHNHTVTFTRSRTSDGPGGY